MNFKEIMRQVNKYLVERGDWQGGPAVVPLTALRALSRAADEGRVVEVPLRGDCETVEVPDLETVKMPELVKQPRRCETCGGTRFWSPVPDAIACRSCGDTRSRWG